MPSVIKRFSMLRRNPALTHGMFSRHYREVHGPLAAALDDPPFDGINVTFQVPRPDYRQGFFQHPDYAKVRPDEEHLFDLSRTVSVLGEETVVLAGEGAAKAIIVGRPGKSGASEDHDVGGSNPAGVSRAGRNDLDAASASALGLGQASVEYGRLWEIWFDSAESRARCLAEPSFLNLVCRGDPQDIAVALAVREVMIF